MQTENGTSPRAGRLPDWTDRRFNRLLFAALVAAAWACADDGAGCDAACDGGCDLLSCDDDGTGPTAPAWVYPDDGPRIGLAAQVHVTQRGLDFVSDNLTPLLGDLLGGDGLSFCLEPVGFEIPGLGEIEICGGGDQCDDGTAGCQLTFEIGEIDLLPVAPDRLAVEIGVLDLDERIGIAGAADCTLILSAERLPIRAAVDFRIDPATGRAHVSLPSDEIEIGLDALGIDVIGEDSLCGVAASAAPLLLGVFAGELTGPIDDLVGDALCRGCSAEVPCPNGASCLDNTCWDPVTDTCLGMDLGLEDAFDLGGLLAGIAPGLQAELGFMAWLAGLARTVDAGPGLGLDLGLELGFTSDPALCVPDAPPPALPEAPLSRELFQALGPAGNPFAIGIGLHRAALDLALWAAYRSGVLCISIGTDTVEQLSSGTFSILVPSLGDLTGGEQRPMQISLQPQKPPRVVLGRGTRTGPEGNPGGDPLLLVVLEDLNLDFYLFAFERFTRVFTLNLDLHLPVDLDTSGEDGIQILLGDVASAITRIEARNAHLLAAADTDGLIEALPSLLGLFLPALTEALEDPIALPELLGFELVLGPGAITALDDGEMLGIFADLQPAAAKIHGLQAAPPIPVLVERNIRPGDALVAQRLQREGAPAAAVAEALTPTVHLRVDARDRDTERPLEIGYRVDRGLWSTWQPEEHFAVETSRLLGEGLRTLDLRVRYADAPGLVSPRTVSVALVQDHTPPTVELVRTPAGLQVDVRDNLTPAHALDLRASIDGGPWIALDGPRALLPASALDGAHAVVVDATDSAGLRTRAEKRLGAGSPPASSSVTPRSGGCAAAPGAGPSGLWLLLGLLLLGRRGPWRWALAAALVVAGCSGDSASSGGDPPPTSDAPPAACAEDGDCDGLAVCTEGLCVDVQCVEESDCASVCRLGGACVGNACVCETGCAGGCPEGTFCCGQSGQCVGFDPCADLTCGEGETPTLRAHPDVDVDACVIRSPGVCECIAADGLPFGTLGARIAAASTADGSLRVVAARNDTYRDLMLGVFGDDGAIAWTSVDGVPEGGAVTGDPDGFRGGIADPGPDAGRDLRMVMTEDGTVWLTSRERRSGSSSALRLTRARIEGGAVNARTVILDDEGISGVWSAPVAEADGSVTVVFTRPRVMRDEELPARWQTEIWAMPVAMNGDTPTPGAAVRVDAVGLEAACGGRCPLQTDRCRVETNRCEVPENVRLCNPRCEDGTQCYAEAEGDGYVCAAVAPQPGVVELPPNAGLFLDARRAPDGALHVVHHDRPNGTLRHIVVDAEGEVAAARVLDGPDEAFPAQAGRFATLHVDEDDAFVAYVDATSGELRVHDLRTGTTTTADDGVRLVGDQVAVHRVGSGVRTARIGGVPWLVYQDATDHSVWAVSRETDGSWSSPERVDFGDATDPLSALGFGLALLVDDRGADVLSWRYRRRAVPPITSVIRAPLAVAADGPTIE